MINPPVIEGRVQGGTAQGLGGALYEHFIYEHFIYDEAGHLLTTTRMDYLLPSATEVPRIGV